MITLLVYELSELRGCGCISSRTPTYDITSIYNAIMTVLLGREKEMYVI